MEKIVRKYIDWTETGKNLEFHRSSNLALKRYVCFALKHKKENCSGKCETCTHDMDKLISRQELGQVFCVTENVIQNWEKGETPVPYEDLLLYQQICGIDINQLVIFEGSNNKK